MTIPKNLTYKPLYQWTIHLHHDQQCLVVQKGIATVSNQEVTKQPKCFSSSDGLVQNCITLSQQFSHKTAALYPEWCTSPLLFHNFQVIS